MSARTLAVQQTQHTGGDLLFHRSQGIPRGADYWDNSTDYVTRIGGELLMD